MKAIKKKAAKEKAPLTPKDWPDAPMGQPILGVSAFLATFVNGTMTRLGSTTIAQARAIRILDQTVPTRTTQTLFFWRSIVRFSPMEESHRSEN
jgi:hypothetical protein